jgi:hypothetical protein
MIRKSALPLNYFPLEQPLNGTHNRVAPFVTQAELPSFDGKALFAATHMRRLAILKLYTTAACLEAIWQDPGLGKGFALGQA